MIVHSSEAEEEDRAPLQVASPQSAKRARNVTRGFLSAVAAHTGAETDAVLLVVSELVTNAVRHAGGVTGFRLVAGPGTVTVSVEDSSATAPRPQRSKSGEPGGFGWHLVQELSADVRVSIGPRGKTVSALLPLSH
ncbi:ATP-binding protein [Streptomyces xiangluensis]|uniref:ATP-binding protein n=1 Tax=Streptomyces xiangluensis TaxID=2665720 RepID=A0ABV8YZB6_9ACTN